MQNWYPSRYKSGRGAFTPTLSARSAQLILSLPSYLSWTRPCQTRGQAEHRIVRARLERRTGLIILTAPQSISRHAPPTEEA